MQQPKNILLRGSLIYLVVVLLSLCIVGRIMVLQLDTKLISESLKKSFREEPIPAKRGDILARDGRLLVTSLPQYQLYLDCMVINNDAEFYAEAKKLAGSLAGFFKDKTAAEYEKILRNGRAKKQRYVKIGTRRITHTELNQVYQFPILVRGRNKSNEYDKNKGGGVFEVKNIRVASYDKLASRTLGLVNENGVAVGIEGSFDYVLKGTPGRRTVEKISGGDWMPVSSENDVMPRNGYDVVTTLDVDMQDAAETALREQLAKTSVFEAGTAIIMEVSTGEIRAIANMMRMPDGSYAEAFNYAIGRSSEPGSTFKLSTLMALLDDGLVELDEKVDAGDGRWMYKGKNFSDVSHEGYGIISVQEAFEKSSNVGFAKLAVEHYAGKEQQYVDRLYAMKLNDKLGLQISGEAAPQLRYVNDKLWSGLSLPMISMGYEVLLTPIKTLTFYNAVANGGRMVKPKFVTELRQDGEVKKRFSTEVITSSICSRSTLEKVHAALLGVVERGTARNIRNEYYKIAGKTGTAQIAFNGVYVQNGYKMHQASFAGFFPADKPRYTGVVVLYTEKTQGDFYGGRWAAPVFKQIADKIYVSHPEWEEVLQPTSDKMLADKIASNAHKNVPEKPTDSKLPSLMGMTLKDALFLLENQGLKVAFSGVGHVVRQSLPVGTLVTKGQTIELELR